MEKEKIAAFLPALLLADGVRDGLCSHRERTAGLLQPGIREALSYYEHSLKETVETSIHLLNS